MALVESVRSRHKVAKDEPLPDRLSLSFRWLFQRRVGTVLLDDLWRSFGAYSKDGASLFLRTLVVVAVLSGAFLMLAPLDTTVPPVRGTVAHSLEVASRWLASMSFFALVYVTLEMYCVATWLVVRIGDRLLVNLSPETKSSVVSLVGLPEESIPTSAHFLPRLRIAAEILGVVDGFVVYSTIAVCALIVGRSSFLDSWAWPITHVLALAWGFVLVLLCVWRSRGSASHARAEALAHMQKMRYSAIGSPTLEAFHGELMREIESYKSGPFAPFWRHPLVHSAAASTLTYASTLLAEPRVSGLLDSSLWGR